MVLLLDHVVIAVTDLDRAADDYQALGFTVIRGGIHANRATHNALIVFADGVYLELLAATGEPALPDQVDFSPMLAGGEGFTGFALRTDDIEAEARRLNEAGFAVGTITEGAREKAGRVMRWKLALIDGGFAPFLIQDITPREWRVPDDPALITHSNHAVGVAAVEIVTREFDAARERYARLTGAPLADYPANLVRDSERFGGIELARFLTPSELYSFDTLPDAFRLFKIPQEDIDRADPAQEPRAFDSMLAGNRDTLGRLRVRESRCQAMSGMLGDRTEALFAVHLVREDVPSDAFTLERAHGVRFEQRMGVSPTRGADILHGLEDVDWAAIRHSYKKNPAMIPGLLRALASANAAVREYARQTLAEDLLYNYEAAYQDTIETIPFLRQLIDAPQVDTFAPLDVLRAIVYSTLDTYNLDDHAIQELEARRRDTLRGVFPVLVRHLSHTEARVRRHVADVLAHHPGDDESLSLLLQFFTRSDSDPEVRARCLWALVCLWTGQGDGSARRPLDEARQAFVAGILRDVAQPVAPRFRAACILLAQDPDRWRDEAIRFFYDMMNTDLPADKPLDSTWNSTLLEVRYVLKDSPDDDASWVVAQARHAHSGVREIMVRALRYLIAGDDGPVRVADVIGLLDDPDPNVRYYAVDAFIGSAHLPDVHDKLQKMAEHDPSLMVRWTAQASLRGAD